MKSILFITRKYPPQVGGMEQFSYDFHTHISNSKEHYVELLHSSAIRLFITCLFLQNKDLQKFTHIHFSDGLTAFLFLILKCKSFSKDISFSCTLHGLDVIYSNFLYQHLLKIVLKKINKIVCVSRATKKEVLKRIPKRKIHVIGNGISLSSLDLTQKVDFSRKKSSKLQVLLMGRQIKRKGTLNFLKYLVTHHKKSLENISIVIAGYGEESKKISNFIVKHDLENQISSLGRVNQQTKQKLLIESDIFVMPNQKVANDMEGFGIVLLEASAHQTIPLACLVDGIPDAITDNFNGHLCSSYKEIIKYLNYYSQNPKTLEKKKKIFSSYTISNYSWDNIALKYQKEVFR